MYFYVQTSYATFAITVVNDIVVFAPPIAKWMVNMNVQDVKSYLSLRGILYMWSEIHVR